jgi:hypothetical protein
MAIDEALERAGRSGFLAETQVTELDYAWYLRTS